MKLPATLEEIIDYLEDVSARYAPIASFGFGFEGEQGNGGRTVYPHLFMEAEILANEVNPGLDAYTAALVFLDIPAQTGPNFGTNAEKVISTNTKQWADEFVEILRMEKQLGTIKASDKLSVSHYGNDGAFGWRVEVSFESHKMIDRAGIKSRLTPPAI